MVIISCFGCAGSEHGQGVVVLGGGFGEADRGVQPECSVVVHGHLQADAPCAFHLELATYSPRHVATDAVALPGRVADEPVRPRVVALAGETQRPDCRLVEFDEQGPFLLRRELLSEAWAG